MLRLSLRFPWPALLGLAPSATLSGAQTSTGRGVTIAGCKHSASLSLSLSLSLELWVSGLVVRAEGVGGYRNGMGEGVARIKKGGPGFVVFCFRNPPPLIHVLFSFLFFVLLYFFKININL